MDLITFVLSRDCARCIYMCSFKSQVYAFYIDLAVCLGYELLFISSSGISVADIVKGNGHLLLILLHRRIFNTLENRNIFCVCLVLPWGSVGYLGVVEPTVSFQNCIKDSYIQCQLIFS